MSQYQLIDKRVPIALDNPAIYHDLEKCKNCTLCRRACADVMSVLDYYDLDANGDVPVCIHCGQCAAACPFDSMHAKSELDLVKAAIQDPNKIVVIQTAPAVRVAIGEGFGYEPGEFLEGKMVGALRALGADYVVDTNFGADLTIMEEASELVERLKTGGTIPQFTSCCPAWVRFAEIYFPEYLPNISTTRSCIAMEAAMIKTYFAEKKGINPADIVSISVNPCTAKKAETKRPEQNKAAHFYDDESLGMDTDISITTREFIRWIQDEGLDFSAVEESQFDELIGMETGASIIFGNTGGVMEAAMRTAYKLITDKEPPPYALTHLEDVRGMEGVKEATVELGDITLSVAVVHGGKNTRDFLNALKTSDKHYDFIEVMACPGGCIGGGGQPRTKLPQAVKTKEARIGGLYKADEDYKYVASYENPEIQALYKDFLGEPLGHTAHELLHTTFVDRSAILGDRKDVTPETCPTSPKYKG